MLKGIRSQVILLSILPSSLVAIAIGIYLNYSHTNEVKSFFYAHGTASVNQIANITKYQILNHQLDTLQLITNASIEENGLRSISIFNAKGKEIAHSGPKLLLIEQLKINTKTNKDLTILSKDQTIAFMRPIKKGDTASDINLFDPIQIKNNYLGWVAIEYTTSQFEMDRYKEGIKKNIIIFFTFIFSMVFGFFFIQRITLDMRNIKKAIKLYADDDSLPTYRRYSIAEFNEISDALCDMAKNKQTELDKLRSNTELIQTELEDTIETIEVQNIELSMAQKESIKASRIKSEFLANTSHEIRTPLNGIIGFTRILKKTPLSTQQQEYLETIEVSSEGLLTIINDILDFSKIEANKMDIAHSPLNLQKTLEEVVSLLAPSAYEKQLEITLIVYQDVPLHVISDSTRIKQIFFNLISNAIKFTHQGEIIVRIELDSIASNSASLQCTISDTGIGMSAAQQKDLFEAFYQASSSTSREYGGTGLGLTIVKTLVELLGGEISVVTSPDKGTDFTFSIALELQAIDEPAPDNSLSKYTVALVEPHEPTRMVTQHMLEKSGIHVQTITSEAKIKETLSLFHSDCVLYGFSSKCDINQVTQKIKTYTGDLTIPIIALSPLSLEHLSSLQSLGTLHCSKPAREHILIRTIAHALLAAPPPVKSIEHSPQPDFHQNKLKALAVDDNPANLHLLGIILDDLGIEVIKAKDGLEAVTLADEINFDIIFMDIQMPILNGTEASKMIRVKSNVPIVALTAHALADEKNHLLTCGINDYLTKPINEDQIKAVIIQLCKKSLPALDKRNTETGVVNLDLCMQLAKHRPAVANELFSMLMASLESDAEEINQLCLQQDFARLLDAAHKLHGATCYTGVEGLKAACYDLENVLKQENLEKLHACMNVFNGCIAALQEWHVQHNFTDELNYHLETHIF